MIKDLLSEDLTIGISATGTSIKSKSMDEELAILEGVAPALIDEDDLAMWS